MPRTKESGIVREATFAELGEACDLAREFVTFWQHGTGTAPLNEWARQLHEELERKLYVEDRPE